MSVRGSATIQQDHILSVVGQRVRIVSVNVWFCSYPANYVPTVGGQWKLQSQCVVLQLPSKVAYRLWVSDGRQSQCVVRLLSGKITYRLLASSGRDKCQWVELLAGNGCYSQLCVFLVRRDHGPSASWRRPRGI